MVYVKLYDNKKIDTLSSDFKEKIAESIKNMILNDWDKKVQITQYTEEHTGLLYALVKIEI